MQPEIKLDLSTGRTSSGEKVSRVEGSRTPEPVIGYGDCRDFHDLGPIEHRWSCWVIIGNHSEDYFRVPYEHRRGEGDVVRTILG